MSRADSGYDKGGDWRVFWRHLENADIRRVNLEKA
jgi:hypothetical protein